MSESFVQYFAACVVNIARRASAAEAFRKKNQSSTSHSLNSLSTSRAGNNSLTNYLFQDDLEPHPDDATASDLADSSEENNLESSSQFAKGRNTNQLQQAFQPRSNKWKQMEEFCSRPLLPLKDPRMTLVEKAWLIIARVDGECGQLLGQAVLEKYDGIRSWVVSYLLWGALSIPASSHHNSNPSLNNLPTDSTLPPSRSDLSRAISELKYLLHDNDLRLSPSSNSPLPVPDLDPRPQLGDFSDQKNDLSHFFFVLIAMEIFQIKRNEIAQHLRQHRLLHQQLLSHQVPSTSSLSPSSLGKLVTVHCGHNGWPNQEELTHFSNYFADIQYALPESLLSEQKEDLIC